MVVLLCCLSRVQIDSEREKTNMQKDIESEKEVGHADGLIVVGCRVHSAWYVFKQTLVRSDERCRDILTKIAMYGGSRFSHMQCS